MQLLSEVLFLTIKKKKNITQYVKANLPWPNLCLINTNHLGKRDTKENSKFVYTL